MLKQAKEKQLLKVNKIRPMITRSQSQTNILPLRSSSRSQLQRFDNLAFLFVTHSKVILVHIYTHTYFYITKQSQRQVVEQLTTQRKCRNEKKRNENQETKKMFLFHLKWYLCFQCATTLFALS